MISKPQDQSDLNDNENFSIGGNVRNVRNVRNVKNLKNARLDIKCDSFLEPQS